MQNSIDIPTNALAQVSASIEQKHLNIPSFSGGTGSPYSYRPGQAFVAARRQSHFQSRKETLNSVDIDDLARSLEASPRRRFNRHFDQAQHKDPVHDEGNMPFTRRLSATNVGGLYRRPLGPSDHPEPILGTSHEGTADLSIAQGHNIPLETSLLAPIQSALPTFSFPRNSTDAPRVSFDAPTPPPHGMAPRPPRQPPNRSSLEAKVHKGLRGISIDMTTSSIQLPHSAAVHKQNGGVTGRETTLRPSLDIGPRSEGVKEINGGTKSKGRVKKYGYGPSHRFGRAPRLQKSTSGLDFDPSDDANEELARDADVDGEGDDDEAAGSEKENVDPALLLKSK